MLAQLVMLIRAHQRWHTHHLLDEVSESFMPRGKAGVTDGLTWRAVQTAAEIASGIPLTTYRLDFFP